MEKTLKTEQIDSINSHADQYINSPLYITLRTHCVSVRLNNAELQLLNTKRGSKSKGEWLRMASLQKLPTIVPPVNIDTWKTLGEINQWGAGQRY